MVKSLELVQVKCERNELELSSLSNCYFERKETGSYYTPIDVCDFFWDEYFNTKNINSKPELENFITEVEFIEPAVGAGIFLFSLLKKLLNLQVSPAKLSNLKVTCYDINNRALSFVEIQKTTLEREHFVSFGQWKLINQDYLSCQLHLSRSKTVFIGNPPFVKNPPNSVFKNAYADFFKKSYEAKLSKVDVAFILPLSFNFSRDYLALRRQMLLDQSSVYTASFDNIPDSLFKTRKLNSPNSNVANSQRCSIVFVYKNGRNKIFSSKLARWKSAERKTVLGKSPHYYDLNKIIDKTQFVRPSSNNIYSYLTEQHPITISDFLLKDGQALHIGGIARNYISFREGVSASNHTLYFKNESTQAEMLSILASDIFYEYWLSCGDGFHLTKADIYYFPVSNALLDWSKSKRDLALQTIQNKINYQKIKLNAGKENISYDFTGIFKFWD